MRKDFSNILVIASPLRFHCCILLTSHEMLNKDGNNVALSPSRVSPRRLSPPDLQPLRRTSRSTSGIEEKRKETKDLRFTRPP